MSLKRFYRYVLITILLVILCFVLTAVCLTFISQKNKILTHTHSVLANIARISGYRKKLLDALYADI